MVIEAQLQDTYIVMIEFNRSICMAVDFRDAAKRHFKDAEYLHQDQRLANADHLYGLSGECALKAVMQGLGMTLNEKGVPEEGKFKKHVPLICNVFSTFVNSRGQAKYAGQLGSPAALFVNYTIEQRYDHRSGITAANVIDHQRDARKTQSIMNQAVLDGVIR